MGIDGDGSLGKGPEYSGRIVTSTAIEDSPKNLHRRPSLAAVRAFVEFRQQPNSLRFAKSTHSKLRESSPIGS